MNLLRKAVKQHFGGAILFLLVFVGLALGLRLTLTLISATQVDWSLALAASYVWGALFDVATALLAGLPIVILLLLTPRSLFRYRPGRIAAHAVALFCIALLVFEFVAEIVFWDEFSNRFNFIAVDYLVYTTEVIRNIVESYPIGWIFAGIFLASALVYWAALSTGLVRLWHEAPAGTRKGRFLFAGGWVASAALLSAVLSVERLPHFDDNYNRELAQNGLWSLFAAFWNNELDYERFYKTLPLDEAFAVIREELAGDGSQFVSDKPEHDTLRYVSNAGVEQHPNIIQITVESLSDKFLHEEYEGKSLTPFLRELESKSLVFDNFYATGTRTTRGMEALTLSLPPTPGRSLVKRPENANLFTLGSVLATRDYDSVFLYGGYGYFDNMNAYFQNNGYRIVDRGSVQDSDVTFANAWGACDEDLFRWTLREADQSAATGKPFHMFIMTTSNHRPYTFPEGRIDLPSKVSGRAGTVRYTDFAIGEFIKEASTREWFKNTVFVIVADHCASVAGKTTLPIDRYKIPLIIYAPGGQVAPGHVTRLASQVDFAPTLLGLLHWSYASRFFGMDASKEDGDQRALLGNYQKLALFEPGTLDVLLPLGAHEAYNYDNQDNSQTPRTTESASDEEKRNETIAYYQTACYMYKYGLYRPVTLDQEQELSQQILELKTQFAQK